MVRARVTLVEKVRIWWIRRLEQKLAEARRQQQILPDRSFENFRAYFDEVQLRRRLREARNHLSDSEGR